MESIRAFEASILHAIEQLGAGAYGVTIMDTLEQQTGKRPSTGSLYSAFERMESRGLVRSWLGAPTAERDGNPKFHLELTPAGREALAAAGV